jgi:hypothetical protein
MSAGTTRNCECCRVQLIDGAPLPKTPGLCSKCDEVWAILPELAPSYRTPILATALSHSVKDIAHRMGCPASHHYTGLGNAVRRSGIDRPRLIRVAAWALGTGQMQKPAGFEDCNPNGWQTKPHGNFYPTEASSRTPVLVSAPNGSGQGAKTDSTIQSIEGVKLIPCPGLPGVSAKGKWARVLDQFLASGESCVRVESAANCAGNIQSMLAAAIRKASRRGDCCATSRGAHCYLVRVKP